MIVEAKEAKDGYSVYISMICVRRVSPGLSASASSALMAEHDDNAKLIMVHRCVRTGEKRREMCPL